MIAVSLSPQARRDMLAAAAWIAQERPDAAQGFLDVLRQTLERLKHHPGLGAQRLDLTKKDYRFFPLRGFPYLLAYRRQGEMILILRCLHGARDIPRLL